MMVKRIAGGSVVLCAALLVLWWWAASPGPSPPDPSPTEVPAAPTRAADAPKIRPARMAPPPVEPPETPRSEAYRLVGEVEGKGVIHCALPADLEEVAVDGVDRFKPHAEAPGNVWSGLVTAAEGRQVVQRFPTDAECPEHMSPDARSACLHPELVGTIAWKDAFPAEQGWCRFDTHPPARMRVAVSGVPEGGFLSAQGCAGAQWDETAQVITVDKLEGQPCKLVVKAIGPGAMTGGVFEIGADEFPVIHLEPTTFDADDVERDAKAAQEMAQVDPLYRALEGDLDPEVRSILVRWKAQELRHAMGRKLIKKWTKETEGRRLKTVEMFEAMNAESAD